MLRNSILLVLACCAVGLLCGVSGLLEKPTNIQGNDASSRTPIEYRADFQKPLAWQAHEQEMEMERKQRKETVTTYRTRPPMEIQLQNVLRALPFP